MKIITICREFGSGGRELGKRLSEELGIPCYDQKIIEMASEKSGYSKDYVARLSERDMRVSYPATIAHSFNSINRIIQPTVDIAVAQQKVIKELAESGDCVMIGRCSDIILQYLNPFNIFVYASSESKIDRCKSRMTENEHYTDNEIFCMMMRIDKERLRFREMFTNQKWGSKESYHLCVNTSDKEIKSLVRGISEYVKCWFDNDFSVK